MPTVKNDPTGQLLFVDSGANEFQSPTECSMPLLSAPFAPLVNVDYVLTQDFVVFESFYSPLPVNTPYAQIPPGATQVDSVFAGTAPATGSNPGFILASEGPRQDMGAGLVRWTRTYAKVPASYSLAQTVTYSWIGWGSHKIGGVSAGGRVRRQSITSCRVQYDYFLLDQSTGKIFDAIGTAIYTGTAGVLPSVGLVPALSEQKYFSNGYESWYLQNTTDTLDWVSNGQYQAPGTAVSGFPNTPNYDQYPTADAYNYWIQHNAWVLGGSVGSEPAAPSGMSSPKANLNSSSGLFELVAIGSQSRSWLGNIVERKTVFILPQ